MQELFKINTDDEHITISARELHDHLQSTERFSNWFNRIQTYGFIENEDFVGCKVFNTLARQELQDYQITIDMAKEIAMLQRNEKGKEIRKKLIELEKAWNSPEKVMARALVMAQKEISNLKIENAEMKPKAEFYNAVVDSETAIDMGSVAKVLNMGIGRNKLFQILRDKKVLQGNNQPYQLYIDRGYFRCIESSYTKPNGDTCVNIKTVVFQKGVDFIRKMIEKEM